MRMNIYRVAPLHSSELLVFAESDYEASEVYITYALATGHLHRNLLIERVDTAMTGDRRLALKALQERGVPGVAVYAEGVGWSLKPPG